MNKIDIKRPQVIFNIMKNNHSKDPLYEFVLHGHKDELAKIQNSNFEILLDACNFVGLTYVFIGSDELCGCERIVHPDPWPAIWHVAKEIGCDGSCGNSDQYQVNKAHLFFGLHRVGAWHVKERRRLTEEEEKSKEFYKVVTGRKGYEVPVY